MALYLKSLRPLKRKQQKRSKKKKKLGVNPSKSHDNSTINCINEINSEISVNNGNTNGHINGEHSSKNKSNSNVISRKTKYKRNRNTKRKRIGFTKEQIDKKQQERILQRKKNKAIMNDNNDEKDSDKEILRDYGINTVRIVKRNSDENIMLNVNGYKYADLKVNDILRIESQKNKDLCIILKINKVSKNKIKNWDLELNKSINEVVKYDKFGNKKVFRFENEMKCYVQKLNPKMLDIDRCELTFKNEYISRGDQWIIQQSLLNQKVNVKENIRVLGYTFCVNSLLRAQNGINIYISVYLCKQDICTFIDECESVNDRVRLNDPNSRMITCGIIKPTTKFVFRSKSVALTILVQISREMTDDDDDGLVYFEKFVDGFLKVKLIY